MFRRIAASTVVVGGLAATAIVVTQANPAGSVATSPSASLAASGLNASQRVVTTAPGGTQSQSQTPSFGAAGGIQGQAQAPFGRRGHGPRGGFGGPDGFGRRGGFGGLIGPRGAALTVTGVNGNTIDATAWGRQAITVTVSATTAYTEAGASASLSDVTTGEHISVQGTRSATDPTTIQARGITIVLPSEGGVVTAVNGTALAVTGFDGATYTINESSSTRYQRAGQSAAASDVVVGRSIIAEGTRNGDGSFNAVRITINLPRVMGTVTAVNGSTITVNSGDRWGSTGVTRTVTLSSNTTYLAPTGASASATSITVESLIAAEGTLSSDGATLAALRVTVLPTMGANSGFGGHGGRDGVGGRGGFGFGGGMSGPSTGGTPSTSTSTTSGSSV